MVEEAALLFAEKGFAISTRDLASEMGVTQALLYRYFTSKDELIDKVFERTFLTAWDPAWSKLLSDRTQRLDSRLSAFYGAYLGSMSYVSMRLFMRAALDSMGFPERYTRRLDRRVLRPVMAELRHEARLPAHAGGKLPDAERELAMVLHSGVVFLGIRKHIYGTRLPDDLSAHVARHVAVFMGGAPVQLRAQLKRRAAVQRKAVRSRP